LIYIADFAFGWLPYNFMQLMGFAIASIFVLIQGFFGQKQGKIFKEDVLNAMTNKHDNETKQTEPLKSEDEIFITKLIDYMKKDKPYLNPDLSIAVLASELNVSSDYLSGILNGKLNRNFFDFINKYRIEEFKIACKDPKNKNYTIISIAYDCGFNSKATFNRVFKAETGYTPGEYQKLQS
jgi:AraC-like DNA-binding protein